MIGFCNPSRWHRLAAWVSRPWSFGAIDGNLSFPGPSLPEEHALGHLARPLAVAAIACLLLLSPSITPARAAAARGQEEVSRNFQKTLPLASGQIFRVENKFGEVRVHGEAGREVRISATIRVQAGSREEAESFSQKIQIEVDQTSGVRVRTIDIDDRSWMYGRHRISYSVNYDIALPVDVPLEVKNNFGNVTVTGVRARSDIDNNHGSLTARDIGPARFSNSFGSIDLTGAAGDAFVSDSNGAVQVTGIKGSLDLRNRFGSITVHNVGGAASIAGGNGNVTVTHAASASVTNSFGNADINNIRGDLTLHDNNGNVEIASIGGSASVSNSYGNITFSDIKGRLECTTNNGLVKGSSVGGGAVSVRDSFGAIELENIAGSLEAETSNGRISVRDARGAVTLRTSFGAIEASNIPKGIRAVTGNGAINLTEIGGDAYAKTNFGAIVADRVNGSFLAEDSNGAVSAKNVKGDATVTTSFSGVGLESIGGRITVDNQNGAIDVSATRGGGCRDISLKTSFSSIRVRVPEGVGYNVSARTSFGRINSDLPITATGTVGGDSLTGTIGSGGCKLQLIDSNGSIEIARAP